MKKSILPVLIAVLLTLFAFSGAGCAPMPAAQTSPDASTSPSAGSGPSPSSLTDEPDANTGTSASKDFGELGIALMANDGLGSLKLGLSERDLVLMLGQPDTKSDAQIWGADGNEHSDWKYASKGLEINMMKQPDDTEASIYSITAKAPCSLATQRGIKVGDTKEAVLKAYANEYDPESGSEDIVLGTIYGGIMIHIENGVVANIFIGAAAE